jgi:heme exporter protein D
MISTRVRKYGWAVVGVMVASLILLFVYSLKQTSETVAVIREAQEANAAQREANDRVLEKIRSCTTPGEKCFRQSQRRTAKVVADINQVTVLAAVCAANASQPTVPVIEECIREQLAAVRGR